MKEPELAIPSGLFRGGRTVPRNDRYAVYRMIHRRVTFRNPPTGDKVTGYVDEVYRDIFAEELRLTIGGRVYRFKEPAIIRENDGEFVFVYADTNAPAREVGDKRFFKEMRQGHYKEDLAGTVHRLTPRQTRECRFILGEKKPSRRKPFLMRGISPEATEEVVE